MLARSIEVVNDLTLSCGPSVIACVDADGGARLSEEWYTLTGRSPEIGDAWSWLEAVHPDDRASLRAAIEKGGPVDLTVRIQLAEGDFRWYLARQAPSSVGRGVLLVDVDALKVEAIRLASMHAKLELAAQAGGIGFWTRELSQPAAPRQLPSSIGHFDFDAWVESIHPEDRLAVMDKIWRSIESDGTFETEYRLVVNGRTRWFTTSGRLLEDLAGQPIELMAVSLDITERKRREITDREDRERVRLALQAAQAGAWEWVGATNELKWSPEFYEMIGLDWEVLPSFPSLLEAIHPDDRERFHTESAPGIRAGSLDIEFRIVHPRKGARWINMRGRAFGDEPQPDRVLGVCIDVTERRAMEEALREAARDLERRVEARTSDLVAATRDIDEFSYTIAHDLRAPLRAIMSTSKILIEDCGDRLDANEIDQLQRQAAAAKRMGLLIDDLLAMARLTRTELVRYDFDVSRLAQEIIDELSGEFPGRIASVTIEPGLRAYADPRLARIALRCLLENSVKFAKPEGAMIEVDRTLSDDGEAVRIQDHGVGFDQAYQGRLFRPFERLHTTDQYTGNGIGLANVKRIVDRHGGQVTATGVPGVGATFCVSFGG